MKRKTIEQLPVTISSWTCDLFYICILVATLLCSEYSDMPNNNVHCTYERASPCVVK